ncbi:class I SAM-dependent methyltransferase [Alteribacter natronophilus]|uniref:class I SAM-dependent methyltransferase n=1 Tax=Alteribacter natronophilus TaxID=2583810 RepID=UPI00110D8F36|nr:class I SAM-dependent methyltransferase [Alteribacter natronophilus]TMW71454.1 class I SAM-dependent methyltransferase [Alteribacter natronophilus]
MLGYYSSLSAEVYDMDKPAGHSFGDVEYYSERLKGVSGKVLEPATGTGRILVPLVKQGFNVEGFDLSGEMLAIARHNCEEHGVKAELRQDNMVTFERSGKYEAVIVPTGTFLLISDRKDSIRALENFYRHLADGGRLILDVFLQTDFEKGRVSVRTWDCENGDRITHENTLVEVDHVNQLTVSHGRYERWRGGKLVESELERFPLRWYGIEEFRMILENIGFQDVVVSADYEYGRPPERADQTVTFEAVK